MRLPAALALLLLLPSSPLAATDVRLLVEGLPVGIADDSVRVEGQGASKGKIWGVTVEPMTQASAVDVPAREAEERIEKLQADDRALEDQAKTADARRKFVESLRSSYSEERAKNLAVRGASWGPVWDARLDPDKESMELALRAEITQQTGEDWKDVKLSVSTAEPGRGLYVPQLESRWLTSAPPPPPPRIRADRPSAMPSMTRAAPMSKAMAMEEREEPVQLLTPQAIAEQGLLAATFTTPRRETVDGSGKARSVALSRFPLKAKIMRVLERKHETAGIVSKDEVYRYGVRVTLKNRYAVPVEVRLLDLVPVSREEKIAVKVLDGTTAATREDPERPGVKIWELRLAAKEEKAVELRYEVRYPRGFPIQGLE